MNHYQTTIAPGGHWSLELRRGTLLRLQDIDRNGNAGPTVWVDGRVVGAWRQDDTGRVELVLLEDVGRRAHRELTARADQLTAWLDGVRVSPRFPSPACRPDARR